MNKDTKKLARKAGFIFYRKDEDSDMPLDWSTNYDNELEKFKQLVRQETLNEVYSLLDALHETVKHNHNYYAYARRLIEEDIGEKK